MKRNELLKNFAIGFIPLFIFIIADEFFGTETGLLIAISAGLAYLMYYLLRYRRLEKFILFDTLLIIVLGLVSILLHDEIFFKLKPALIELILVILLGIHAFSSKPILLMLSKRYMGEMEFAADQVRLMRVLSRILFFVFSAHTILIVYAAYFWSKPVWAFISGGLFYILFAIILLGQWVYFKFFMGQKRTDRPNAKQEGEWFDLVDVNGRTVGKAPRHVVHGNPQLLHAVVHLHIFNRRGQLYLQKRAVTKDLYPGLWDTAVGGHVHHGETVEQALQREAREELGIAIDQAKPLFRYVIRNERESEFIHGFEMVYDGPFEPNPDEVESGHFWSAFEIQKLIGEQVFTPNFEQEFSMLKRLKRF